MGVPFELFGHFVYATDLGNALGQYLRLCPTTQPVEDAALRLRAGTGRCRGKVTQTPGIRSAASAGQRAAARRTASALYGCVYHVRSTLSVCCGRCAACRQRRRVVAAPHRAAPLVYYS